MIQIVTTYPTIPPVELGKIRVWNPTTHVVTTTVTTVLPFAQGVYRGGSPFRATNATSEPSEHVVQERVGMLWPDGSWRYARIHFRCDCPPGVDGKLVTIERGQASIVPTFALHADVAATLGIGWPLWNFGVGSDGVDVLHANQFTVIEQTPLTLVLRYRARVPNTPFWCELFIQLQNGQRHARWWKWYGNSWIDDPLRTSVDYTLPGHIDLIVRGARVAVRHAALKEQLRTVTGPDTILRLMASTEASGFFPDGAAQALTGVLLFGLEPTALDLGAEAETWRGMYEDDVFAVATTWRESVAFGPFGHVLPRPPWVPDDETYRARAVQRAIIEYSDGAITGGGPWAWQQYGCNPSPGDSGTQRDFGAHRYQGVASSGHPAGLKAAQRSAYQDFCRPNVFRFADVSPWSQAARPTFFWSGRPQHRDINADPLGKERRDIGNEAFPRNDPNRKWRCYDRQHYSQNDLAFYALLTGDLLARELCGYRADVWMAEHTYPGSPGGGFSGDNVDPGRGRGRPWQVAMQLLLVNGRDDFEAWCRERFTTRELAIWESKDNSWEWASFGSERPGTPPNKRDLYVRFYRVWEQLQSVQGYGAVERVLGIAQAKTDALRIAKSVALGGIEHRTETSSDQRYQLWPNSTWSAPGNPPFGTVVTCGAATGRIAYYRMPVGNNDYNGFVQLYNCTGTWINGADLVADTGARLTWQTEVRYRHDRTEVLFQGAQNGGAFLSQAQRIELEPLLPPNEEHPLRNLKVGGITLAWHFGGVLLLREWAQEAGDAVAEAAAQAILDNWLPARGAPDGGFLDEGEGAWSQWATVDDPWA